MITKPLGEIADILISNVDKKSKDNEKEVKLCNFVDVYYNWAITASNEKDFMIATASDAAIDKFTLHKGDVAITKDSETRNDIGVATYISEELDNVLLGYHCILIHPNEEIVLGKYLNVVLHSSYAQKYFEANASGSGQRYTLTDTLVKEMPIPLPDINIQRKIGDIPSYIDRKIENNNKINAELESMAKTIYDYWFLQFEFPNDEGKPYKSSGGKMVWNEELKREIPEGWRAINLSNIIDISSDRIKIEDIEDRKYVPIEMIPRKQMSFYETAEIEKAATGLCPFDEKAILLSNRRVYFHKVSISPYDGITRDTVIIINPKDMDNLGFVFQQVYSDYFIKYATLNSYGSEQPVLSPVSVENYKIAYPNNNIDKKYSECVNDLINKVLNNQRENKELTSLRDFLLPMLMNGQISIKRGQKSAN